MMDRRTFLVSGAWLSATGFASPWMAHASGTRNTLAVVDTGLVSAKAFADAAARGAMPVFDTGDDIGTLWYSTLAPRLAGSRALLIGVTRASDYFVLGQLALRSGRMVEHRREQYGADSAAVAFLLGPRVT